MAVTTVTAAAPASAAAAASLTASAPGTDSASAPASGAAVASASAPAPASAPASATASAPAAAAASASAPSSITEIQARFLGKTPKRWGQTLPGIRTHLDTADRTIALTFDLCDGRGYDEPLVDFLLREHVAATLFVTGKWIRRNAALFRSLSRKPEFEIENHGLRHKPASVSGKSAYGIEGTRSVADLLDEVSSNAAQIEAVTGRHPHLFRSGTAFYDDVAVSVITALGDEPVGYSILGDAGGSMSAGEVEAALRKADPGAIAILHMNHPASGTARGVMAAVPALRRAGFRFVKLSDQRLR